MLAKDDLSTRGKPLLSHEGYSYTFNSCYLIKSTNKIKTQWVCRKRKSHHCLGQLNCTQITDNEGNHTYEDIRKTTAHSCNIVPYETQQNIALNTIKEDVKQGKRLKVSYDNVTNNLDENVMFSMKSKERLARSGRRWATQFFPSVRSDKVKFDYPNLWKYLHADENKEQFLLIDENYKSADGMEQRLLIYGLSSQIERLCNNITWYMDGTFKVTPNPFKQLFTIHYKADYHTIPSIYCLLTNKTQQTYELLFQKIQQIALSKNYQIKTTHAMLDFEVAARNAIQNVLKFQVHGCFFHFAKALKSNINTKNLSVGLVFLFIDLFNFSFILS
jgi:hypothetical protein